MSARRHSLPARLSWVAALAIALLLGAWLFSTFPFNAPDEASHYLRALSITNGKLLGPKIPYTAPSPITPQERQWTSANTRAVEVPTNLSPPIITCAAHNQPDTAPGGCVEESYTGNYPPLPYLLPAAALAVSSDTADALWLARVGSALPCLAFILLAFMFAARGGPWPLFGLAVALSPMTLFVSSVVNPNGLQVASSLAFAAGLLRVVRDPETTSRGEVAAIAVSGGAVVLAGSWGRCSRSAIWPSPAPCSIVGVPASFNDDGGWFASSPAVVPNCCSCTPSGPRSAALCTAASGCTRSAATYPPPPASSARFCTRASAVSAS